ncbi:hypothetical protein QTP70_020544, partial [Hemibagrus guttatus]
LQFSRVQSSFSEDAEECLPKVLTENNVLGHEGKRLSSAAGSGVTFPAFPFPQTGSLQPQSASVGLAVDAKCGHPHNWNAISKECLSLLSDLTQRLVAHHDVVASNGRTKPLSERSDPRSTSSSCSVTSGTEDLPDSPHRSALTRTPGSVFGSAVKGVNSPLTAPFTPDLTAPFSSPALRPLLGAQVAHRPWLGSVQSPHVTRRNPKLWSTSIDSQTNGSPPPSPDPVPKPAEQQKPSFLSQWLQNRKEQVKGFLAKRVLVVYLFNKLPEASSQALFADSQAHIWALEGLSHLVAASYSEDKYGVVQTTLPSILSCMLSLQEAVDRHFKLPHASSKPGKTSYSLGDSAYKTLRFALRATLKTAIYRITTTFREHLHAVSIPAEQQKRLQQFLEYKE